MKSLYSMQKDMGSTTIQKPQPIGWPERKKSVISIFPESKNRENASGVLTHIVVEKNPELAAEWRAKALATGLGTHNGLLVFEDLPA